LEPVLEALLALDWVGLLQEDRTEASARWVLLADPNAALLAPLLNLLLLQREASTQNLWNSSRWATLTLRDVL